MPDETIKITVQYVGKDDFGEVVHGNPIFHALKLQAMKKFGLEPSAASQYVLQHDEVDLDDKAHVSSLNVAAVILVLTLKEEPVKGLNG